MRLPKVGNSQLGLTVLLPTKTVAGFIMILVDFLARFMAAGKLKMQAIGACMRKLVVLCYGVLKNRKPFDPQWLAARPAARGSPVDPPAAGRATGITA